MLANTLVAHTDAVWGLSIHSSKMNLLSCSADGTVRLWSPSSKSPLLNTFRVEDEVGVPTSVDFVRCEPSQMVCAFTTANTYIYDIETAKQVIALESNTESGKDLTFIRYDSIFVKVTFDYHILTLRRIY